MRGLRTIPSLMRSDFEMVKSHLWTPGPRRSDRRVGSVRNVNGSLGLNCVMSNHSSTVCGLSSDTLTRSALIESGAPDWKVPIQFTCQPPKIWLNIEFSL